MTTCEVCHRPSYTARHPHCYKLEPITTWGPSAVGTCEVCRVLTRDFYAGKSFERQQQRDALGDDEHGRKSW